MGLREEKKAQTRERLLDAAYLLFDERGYDATKVEDVARAARVSPRTVYRYFPTKADLLFSDTAENIARAVELIAARPANEPPFVALRNALIELAPALDTPINAARARIIAANPTPYQHSLEVRDAWGTAFGEALAARERPGADPAECMLLGHLGMTALLLSLRAWRDAAGGGSASSFTRRTLDALPRLIIQA